MRRPAASAYPLDDLFDFRFTLPPANLDSNDKSKATPISNSPDVIISPPSARMSARRLIAKVCNVTTAVVRNSLQSPTPCEQLEQAGRGQMVLMTSRSRDFFKERSCP